MASVVSPFAEIRSARLDIEPTSGASFWSSGHGHLDIDWDNDANMMVICLDRDGRVVEWNQRARELTDLAQHELVGYKFAHHLISCSLAAVMDKVLKEAWEGGDVGCFQIPFFTKSGKKLLLMVRVAYDSSRLAECVKIKALTAVEIARRQHAEASATLSVHVDLDGRVKGWDAGAQHISGYSQADMMGKGFVSNIVPSHARAPLEYAFKQAVMGKEHYLKSAIPSYTKFGSKEMLLFRTLPVFQVRGEVMRGPVVGVMFVAHLTQGQGWIADEVGDVAH